MSELHVARPKQMQPATKGEIMQPAPQPDSGASASLPMKGSELRAQLRMQPTCNSAATSGEVPSAKVASVAEGRPRYRWLILKADGRAREVCCLPEMTASELAHCYPGSRLVPLPDSAAEAGALIHERKEAA